MVRSPPVPRTATSHPSPSRRSPVASVAHQDLGPGLPRLGRERRLESRAIEDEPHVALGHPHLGAVRRPEDHLRDPPRHPRRPGGIDELGEPGAPHALAAAHRCADRPIALEERHGERAVARQELPSRDQTGRATSHHEHIAAARARTHASTSGRGTIRSALTGHGATHFRHPVQIESSMSRPSRRMPIAPGGQRGKHSPHASQEFSSTIAISSDGRIPSSQWGM